MESTKYCDLNAALLGGFLLGLIIHALTQPRATAPPEAQGSDGSSGAAQPHDTAPSEPSGLPTTSETGTTVIRSADGVVTDTQNGNTALISSAKAPKHVAVALAYHSLFATPLVLTAEPRPPFQPKSRNITQVPRTTLPPWEIAFEANVKQSRLLGLPEELLLLILQLADIPDLYMWRQVSFTFWRIYRSRYFRNFHREGKRFHEIREGLRGFEHDEETIKRAREQAYCNKCLAKRLDGGVLGDGWTLHCEIIYCSFCRTNHWRSSFSHKQRNQNNALRRCILWEGHFRVCPHETISMSFITDYVNRIGITDKKPHTYHDIVICRVCEAVAGNLAGKNAHIIGNISPPKVSLMNTGPDYRGRPQAMFSLEWKLPVFEIPEDRDVTYPLLLQRLGEFEETYGDMLCPHVRLERLLAPFDSRLCVCLGGDRRVGGVGPCERNIDWVDHHRPARGCKRNDTVQTPGVFLSRENNFWYTHEVACRDYCGKYIWARKGRFVFLSRHTSCVMYADGTGTGWYTHSNNMLEPQSYGAKDDIEAKHVLWCDDKACKNGRKWKDGRS